LRQVEAAIRTGFSRSTAVAIEKGAPSVAIGQVFRYLEAIAPGKTLDKLLNETDSAVLSLAASEQRQRARKQSDKALKILQDHSGRIRSLVPGARRCSRQRALAAHNTSHRHRQFAT
jgi:hypothetical protein